MRIAPPNLSAGFEFENVQRIYRGEPALVNGELPEDVLRPREFEALTHVAGGSSYNAAAQEMDVALTTVRTHLHNGFGRLGIIARSQLAGYFPLEADETVGDKKLADLGGRPRRIDLLQALSVGQCYKQYALNEHLSVSTARTHMTHIGEIWPDSRGGLRSTIVANGIRAQYVRALEASPLSIGREVLGTFTLPKLKSIEPKILRLIESQESEAGVAEARV